MHDSVAMARLAAANNAEWSDLVGRSHGIHGCFDGDAWTSPTRTPTFYPDAVTLVPDVSVPELLARIDTSVGCSIKDSFASVDLSAFGFEVLFDAAWTVRRAAPVPGPARADGPHWDVVRDAEGFAAWEQAWRGDDGPSDVLRPDLLEDERVLVLAARAGAHVVAGAVLNRSAEVVGVSNFFADEGRRDSAWAGCLACIGALMPGTVLVGYERDEVRRHHADVDAVETVGPLRVWMRVG